jgi:hypothetical protein
MRIAACVHNAERGMSAMRPSQKPQAACQPCDADALEFESAIPIRRSAKFRAAHL